MLNPAQVEALQDLLSVLDLIGVAVFAISGALVAARREMDPIGFVFVGTATGIGGGTLRDLLLGVRPVFWVSDPSFLIVCIVASLATFWAARLLASRYRALLWMDAVGLAMFAVAGTQKAVALGASPVVSVLMGVMSAAFGGLIRDIMTGEKPLIFHKEIYATAAMAAAIVFLVLEASGLSVELASIGGFAAGFATRAAAILFGLSMPAYKRPDKPLDGPPPVR